MKKFISAVSALCVTASMFVASAPAAVGALTLDQIPDSMTYKLSAIEETNTAVKNLGGKYEVSADAIAAGDVTIPCAMYVDNSVEFNMTSITANIGISAKSVDTSAITLTPMKGNILTTSYYSSARTFTTSEGETFETDQRPFFAAELFEGEYMPKGNFASAYFDSYADWGLTLPSFNAVWASGSADMWTGASSDEYPFCYFDVTLKKGAKAGDYVIDFNEFFKDEKHLAPSNVVSSGVTNYEYTGLMQASTGEGLLKYEPLVISVGGSTVEPTTTTTTSAKPTTTTTTATKPPVPGDGYVFSYDQAEYVGVKGQALTLKLMLDTNGGPLTAADAGLILKDASGNALIHEKGGSSPVYVSKVLEKSAATGNNWGVNDLDSYYNSGVSSDPFVGTDKNPCNLMFMGFAGAYAENGALISAVPDASKAFLTYQVTVADDCPDGLYYVDMTYVMLQREPSNGGPTDWVTDAEIKTATAVIKVGDTEQPTTTTTTTSKPTTTTTTTTTKPTIDPNGRLLGDANVNGVVNVADVVVLNKMLAGKGDLTEQGIINAEVSNPVNAAADANLTSDDSTYIIKSIVHLYDLTANGPVATQYNK